VSESEATFQLGYVVAPSADHPNAATHGEAYAAWWILAPSLDAAEKLARESLRQDHWTVVERDYGYAVTADEYTDERADLLEYYEQAQTDKEVCLTYLSPRFSVYRVEAAVRRPGDDGGFEPAEAHYFAAGDSLTDDDEKLYESGFWSQTRVEQVHARARERIVEEGWELLSVVREGPVDGTDLDEDVAQYHDDAEEDGGCLVFFRD